jgi:hypothetical protein
VVSDFQLADILHKQDVTGRISKWAMELGALTLDFKPRTAIKSQALVDFMVEWRENQVEALTNQPQYWVMYFDGSLKLGCGGAGVLFISLSGEQLKYLFQILFEVSNNEAEYEALLHRLLSVFYRLPTEGYTQGGKFYVRRRRDQDLEGARNTKLRQVQAARCVIPYVLCGGLYCLWYRMIWRSSF